MKDLMKRLLCVLMALMMVMALVACGESDDDDDDDRGSKRSNKEDTEEVSDEEETTEDTAEAEPTLVGEWEGEIDMTEFLNEALGEELGTDDIIDEFVIKMNIEFEDDGTCVLAIDTKHMESQLEDFAEAMWDLMVDMIVEEADVTASEAEDLLEEQGMTKDNLLEQMGLDSMFDEYEDMEGYWILDGDKLYIDEYDAEDADPIEIEFDGDTFSMVGGDGMDMDGMEDYVLPIVFERV